MIILDTSAVIELLKDTEKGRKVMDIVLGKEVSITSITTHELLFGIKERELSALYAFLGSVNTLYFDSLAAFESSKIKKELASKGRLIGETDIFISGICASTKSELVTFDKDFYEVTGIEKTVLE